MKRFLITTSLSFVAGLLVASCIHFFFMRWRLGRSYSIHAASEAGICLQALNRLREGDTNRAISCLELRLYGDSLVLEAMPQSEIDTAMLVRVQQYQAKYPYKSQKVTDQNCN
jgi:hypothetical protein